MFLPYWVIVRCISVYLDAKFLFIFDHMIMRLLLSTEPLVCLLFGFKQYWYKIILN
jgi:hypothetical protein